MTTEIIFHGHSCFEIKAAGKSILIDPFITGNPVATISPDDLNPDFIIISHGHEDHVGDTIAIAKRTGAKVISNFEIINWFGKQGVENVHPLHIGGGNNFDFGYAKLTIAHHGSSLPDGSYGGNPAGILLKLEGINIYHAADTALFYDMKFIGEENIDVAILPIGDNFTMGPADSIKAISLINPLKVIPCHYNTWPLIAQDDIDWADKVKKGTKATPVIMKPSESITL